MQCPFLIVGLGNGQQFQPLRSALLSAKLQCPHCRFLKSNVLPFVIAVPPFKEALGLLAFTSPSAWVATVLRV